jgi:hypothetical protein
VKRLDGSFRRSPMGRWSGQTESSSPA